MRGNMMLLGKRKRKGGNIMIQGRRWLAAVLCTVIAAGLCGCGKQDAAVDDMAEPVKGRYVESQEALPQELEDWKIKQLFTVNDELHLLAVQQQEEKTILREWASKEDGFVDVTQDWLAVLELNCMDWAEVKLLQEEGGVQYLFAGYATEGEYKGHLWRGQGETAEEITPEKWTVPDEQWGSYEYIMDIEALDNGTLVTYSYQSVDIFQGGDGSLLKSEPVTAQYGESFTGDGENVYLSLMDEAGGLSVAGIEKRKDGREDSAEMISVPENTGNVQFCALKGGILIAAGNQGIFRYQPEAAEWEKLIDGMETDFSLTSCWCVDISAISDGRIYALFQESGGGVKLNRYEYDPEAVIEVKETLKLYTVHDSSLLNQAAAMYHRMHPEVLISVEYAYPMYYYDKTDYNAVYQELNTMLMGDGAPDILVMDHLNMDSYAEKGLLADINDVVEPLEQSGALLSNITGSYVQEDGSRYIVPLQFGFWIAAGRDIAAENMVSMKNLAEFLSTQDYSYLGDQTVSELVDKFYPHFCNEIVQGKQLNQEALGQTLDYLKIIADNSGMVSSRGKDEKCFNVWDLADQGKLAFEEADGFKGCMFPIAIVDYIKGEFTVFESSFIPSVQVGICAKSRYTETAKDFLRFALSEEIQDKDYYSGFAVNSASLEKQSVQDRSEAEAETAIMVDGGYEEFQIKSYSQETAEKLLELCKTLCKPIQEDSKIREVLIEALEGYLNGNQSKEETIQQIEGGLKMYLAE